MAAWPVSTTHQSENPSHSICVVYFAFVNTIESITYTNNY